MNGEVMIDPYIKILKNDYVEPNFVLFDVKMFSDMASESAIKKLFNILINDNFDPDGDGVNKTNELKITRLGCNIFGVLKMIVFSDPVDFLECDFFPIYNDGNAKTLKSKNKSKISSVALVFDKSKKNFENIVKLFNVIQDYTERIHGKNMSVENGKIWMEIDWKYLNDNQNLKRPRFNLNLGIFPNDEIDKIRYIKTCNTFIKNKSKMCFSVIIKEGDIECPKFVINRID